MNHFQKTAAIAAALAVLATLSASAAKNKEPPTAKDAVEKIDQAVKAIKANKKSDAKKMLSEANKILKGLPKSEETSDVKGYYYKTNAEFELIINANIEKFEKNKALCEEASTQYGTNINYFAATFYADVGRQCYNNFWRTFDESFSEKGNQFYDKARDSFRKAFEIDKDFKYTNGSDLVKFTRSFSAEVYPDECINVFDRYLNSKYTNYFNDIGALSTSTYEKASKKIPEAIVKAVLCSILDFESTPNPDGNAIVALIEKNFSKYKECAGAIAFVKKFYSNSPLTQADLNSLPEGVREFMPVRYMYKMKTSNDVAALNKEFGAFFGNTANYKARIAAKK